MVQAAEDKALRKIHFKEGRHSSSKKDFTMRQRYLNLTKILIVCLSSSSELGIDDLFKPFKEQHSHNTWGARRYVLIPKNENLFLWFQISPS